MATPPLIGDLLGGSVPAMVTATPLPTATPPTSSFTPSWTPVPPSTLLAPTENNANGLQIDGCFAIRDGALYLDAVLSNRNPAAPLGPFQVKFKQNFLQIQPISPIPVESLAVGQSQQISIQCSFSTTPSAPPTENAAVIQAALRLNNSVTVFFSIPLFLHLFFANDGRLEKEDYLPLWRRIPTENSEEISGLTTVSVTDLQKKLETNKVFFVAQRNVEGHDVLYMSAKTIDGQVFLMELVVIPSSRTCKLCVKTEAVGCVTPLVQSVRLILTQ